MILLLGWVYAADMAWECRSFTTALEAIDYRDAEADGELSTAYDTLYALLDGNCVATSCGWECEEIVDCTTEAGHLINWFSETTEPWSAGRVTLVQIEVVPAASSGYSWTIAEYTSQTGDYYWPYLQTERATFSYDGDWDGGYPTNGTISRSRWRDDKSGEIDTWDDGTCAWRRSYQDGDGSFRWDLTVNGTDLRVEQWSMGCAADEAAAVDFNGVYVGLVDYRTWEPVTDADLDGSPASLDCDDNDPNRSGCAAENPHDSIDNNCDGVADDGDADDDGFLAPESFGEDCDDDDAATYPGAPDTFGDGVDQDCNGMDHAALRPPRWGSGGLVWPG